MILITFNDVNVIFFGFFYDLNQFYLFKIDYN